MTLLKNTEKDKEDIDPNFEDVCRDSISFKSEDDKFFLKQGRKVFLLMEKSRNAIKKASLEEVYIINKEWFDKWEKFIDIERCKRTCSAEKLETYKNMNRKLPYQVKGEKPGKLDNSSLLIPIDSFLNTGDPLAEENLKVRENAIEDKDYVIVSKDVWEIFKEYYGAEPEIKRGPKDEEVYNNEYDVVEKKVQILFIPRREAINEEIVNNLRICYMYFSVYTEVSKIIFEINKCILANPDLKNYLGVDGEISNCMFYCLLKNSTLDSLKKFIQSKCDDIKEGKTLHSELYMVRSISGFHIRNIFKDNISSESFVYEYCPKNSIFITQDPGTIANFIYIRKGRKETELELKEQARKRIKTNHLENDFQNIEFENQFEPFTAFHPEEEDISQTALDPEHNLGGIVGLQNIGNTCYMNTGIQCLSNCKELAEYFIKDFYKAHLNTESSEGTKGELANAFGDLLKKLWYGSKTIIIPRKFKFEMGKFQPMFSKLEQNDVQEFLGYLLDGLHEDLNKVKTKKKVEKSTPTKANEIDEPKREWELFLVNNQSFIADTFYGQFRSTVICPECSHKSESFQSFNSLSLSITRLLRKDLLKCFFIFSDISIKPIEFTISFSKDMTVGVFRKKISLILGIGPETFDILKNESSTFTELDPKQFFTISDFLSFRDTIFLVQIPPYVTKEEVDYKNIYQRLSTSLQETEENIADFEDSHYFSQTYHNFSTQPEKEIWVKGIFEMKTYEDSKDKSLPSKDISFPRIIYINSLWNNIELYENLINHFSPILEKYAEELEKKDSRSLKELFFEKLNRKLTKTIIPFYKNFKTLGLPFVIVFQRIKRRDETGIKSLLDDDHEDNSIIIGLSDSILSENLSKKISNNIQEAVNYEMKFTLVWTNQLEEILKNIYEHQTISYIPKIEKTETEKSFLKELLDNFSKKEKLSEENKWKCEKCNKEQLAEKKIEIFRCPDFLIIHLKRFKNQTKIDQMIDFPITDLDMSEYIQDKDCEKIYDLFAIANHVGSFQGGHYFAYAKNWKSNKWYLYNDSSVSEIEDLSTLVSPNAYVLFYRRRGHPTSEEVEQLYKKEFIDYTV